MADREVKVTIKGKDELSPEAKKAEGALGSFTDKIKGVGLAAAAVVSAAALGKFFKDSVDEAAKAEVGMGRLGVAVRNTGNDFDALKPQLEAAVSSVMKMSTATDDDLREALTRMITVSGDVRGSMENLALVTDLAAFKNVDLETAAISVGKAMNGNTMELNRLGFAGKDSTTVLNNLRASVGGFAANEANTFSGKIKILNRDWGEFKEAVGVAIMSGDQMGDAAGWLATILANLAKWVKNNEVAIGVFKDAVVAGWSALFDMAKVIWDVVGPPLTWLAKVAFVGIIAALNTTALGVKRTAGVFQEFAGTALAAIGSLVEKGGKVLKMFGVDVVQSTGASLKRFGEDMVANGTAMADRATTEYSAAMGRLGTLITGAEEKHTDTVKKGTAARVTIVKEGVAEIEADHLAMEIARQKAARESDELFVKVAKALKDINLKAHSEQWQEIDRNVRLVKGDLSDLLPPAEDLKAEIDKNNEALKRNRETAKDVKNEFKDTVDGAVQIGRSLLDVAQASGLVDSNMASVVNSVLNIGSSLARIGVDPLGGMVGVLSGLANVITGIGNSAAHQQMRAALAQNKDALDRLSREVGNLNLSATGKDFQGTEKAVAATQAALAGGQFDSIRGPGRGAAVLEFFKKQLLASGVSFGDAKDLLDQLGFGDALSTPGTFMNSLSDIKKGFGDTEFGQFGQDFESQLRAITEGFGIRGIEDPTQKLGQLGDLAGRFSPALGAALGASDPKAALLALFGKLQTGGLTPGDFGDLSGGQFLDLLKLLLEQLNAGGSILQTGGLDPGTIEDGIGFPSSPPLSGGSGPFGAAPNIGSINFGDINVGPFTLDPEGKTIDDLAPELAEKLSKEMLRRFASQSAAQGVPI